MHRPWPLGSKQQAGRSTRAVTLSIYYTSLAHTLRACVPDVSGHFIKLTVPSSLNVDTTLTIFFVDLRKHVLYKAL